MMKFSITALLRRVVRFFRTNLKWRVNLIYILIFLFGAVITARLVSLQILDSELYRALAKGQQEIFQPISGQRGEIFLYDKDNLVLAATNANFHFCFVVPKRINDKERVAQLIAPVLDINDKELLQELKANEDKLFLLVKRRLSTEEIDEITELNLEGVHLQEEPWRYYPYQTLASDVLGFVNQDSEGQYGIEEYWDDILTGKEGWKKIVHGPFGRFLEGDSGNSIKGADIILTIDKNIQSQAEKLLKDFSVDFGFETGQIIVLQPSDGRVLALADFPDFNPNEYRSHAEEQELELFQNKAIQSLYEPGSVFKAFTMSAALNEGKITPETTYIDYGYVSLPGGGRISNYDNRVWGEQTMTEVLEKSINTGAVFAQSQISHEVFLDYLTRFGIFKKTGIHLQGEIYSENKEFKKGWESNFITASFGHGIEMSLLQVAGIYAAIANKGTVIQPYIVEQIVKNGQSQQARKEDNPLQIILPQTALDLTKMLVSATENGYAKPARVSGYHTAGKTGTSQIPYSFLGMNQLGYSGQTWQSFAGFAPAFDPRFVIVVKLDNPLTRTSSESSAFIFHDLAKYILDYYQIPPDF